MKRILMSGIAVFGLAIALTAQAQQAPAPGAAPAAAQAPGAGAPGGRGGRGPQVPAGPPKIQVLIITGQSFLHDWRTSTPVLKKHLEDSGKFEVRVTEEFRGAGPETLAPYDVVVLNYSDGYGTNPQLGWGDRANNALLSFVRSGKGLVAYHFALSAFYNWPEYEKLTGCNWRANQGSHSPRHDFVVDIKDKTHPITQGMDTSYPHKNDELYSNLKCQPDVKMQVLATAYDDHSRYIPRPGAQYEKFVASGPGMDRPILWTHNYGSGKVFVTTLGHEASLISDPIFISSFTRGTEWAATGKVTIPPVKQ